MDNVAKGSQDRSSIFVLTSREIPPPSAVQPKCTLPSDLAPAQCPTPSGHVFTPPIAQEWTENGPDFFGP